jgi:hypothetical protein
MARSCMLVWPDDGQVIGAWDVFLPSQWWPTNEYSHADEGVPLTIGRNVTGMFGILILKTHGEDEQ